MSIVEEAKYHYSFRQLKKYAVGSSLLDSQHVPCINFKANDRKDYHNN